MSINNIFNAMSYEELDRLHNNIYIELGKRIKDRIEAGVYPSLSENEKYFISRNRIIDALKSYRLRNKSIGLRETKMIFDHYKENEEN